MKKFKILIGKHYELLSLTETNNTMPEDTDTYYDMGSDMKIPDFVLIRAENEQDAREKALAFIRSWKQKHQSERE
jgi:hypothetical protein